jgi:hypothetical protein
MFMYNLEQGEPCLGWVRAARSWRGSLYDDLWGWDNMLGRANHNTNYSRIALIRAHSRYFTHPAIRSFLYHNCTVSPRSRIGCDWEKDADLEYVNAQTERHSTKSEGAYESALVYVEHFHSLDHVDRVYRELFGLDVHTPIEARTGFKDTVFALIKWLERCLEAHSDDPSSHNINPFTGLSAGSYDQRHAYPWQHIRAVNWGGSGPIGYPSAKEDTVAFAWRHLHDNMPGYVKWR